MPPKFEFIEVKPSNTDVINSRQKVRSHAARAGSNADPSNLPTEPRQRRRRKKAIVWPLTLNPADATSSVQNREAHGSEGVSSRVISQRPPQDTLSVVDSYVLVPFAGNDTILPISHSKLYPLPFLSLVLDNYLLHLAGEMPEVDGPTETGLLKKSWFPMVLHSKILFQVIVLISASHYAMTQGTQEHTQDVLFIKHCALQDLQKVLFNEGVFDKDENIAAVGKLASYEAIFGTEEAYHVHMNALERMLSHRGGLSALGMNGFLARLLIFIDTNSAFLLNTRLHLPESIFPRQEPVVPPNLARFTGSSWSGNQTR